MRCVSDGPTFGNNGYFVFTVVMDVCRDAVRSSLTIFPHHSARGQGDVMEIVFLFFVFFLLFLFKFLFGDQDTR